MWMFPIWFLELIVYGGLLLCGLGAVALVVFLIFDSQKKQIW
jgi:hypothetical protein